MQEKTEAEIVNVKEDLEALRYIIDVFRSDFNFDLYNKNEAPTLNGVGEWREVPAILSHITTSLTNDVKKLEEVIENLAKERVIK